MTSIYDKINIRKSHPGLYRSILTLGVMDLALAANFFLTTPTFNPLGIPKNAVGIIFLALGVSQLLFLNVFRDLVKVRITLATSIFWFSFWGLLNCHQFINGRASLQLPILFNAIAFLQVPLLTEAPINPMTEKD